MTARLGDQLVLCSCLKEGRQTYPHCLLKAGGGTPLSQSVPHLCPGLPLCSLCSKEHEDRFPRHSSWLSSCHSELQGGCSETVGKAPFSAVSTSSATIAFRRRQGAPWFGCYGERDLCAPYLHTNSPWQAFQKIPWSQPCPLLTHRQCFPAISQAQSSRASPGHWTLGLPPGSC